jgi:hypothetical protein
LQQSLCRDKRASESLTCDEHIKNHCTHLAEAGSPCEQCVLSVMDGIHKYLEDTQLLQTCTRDQIDHFCFFTGIAGNPTRYPSLPPIDMTYHKHSAPGLGAYGKKLDHQSPVLDAYGKELEHQAPLLDAHAPGVTPTLAPSLVPLEITGGDDAEYAPTSAGARQAGLKHATIPEAPTLDPLPTTDANDAEYVPAPAGTTQMQAILRNAIPEAPTLDPLPTTGGDDAEYVPAPAVARQEAETIRPAIPEAPTLDPLPTTSGDDAEYVPAPASPRHAETRHAIPEAPILDPLPTTSGDDTKHVPNPRRDSHYHPHYSPWH